MQSLRRSAISSARTFRTPVSRPVLRRLAHDSSSGSQEESFGTGFYITLGTIAGAVILYNLNSSDSTQKSYWTGVIESYFDSKETVIERNAMHTAAVEQAAADRILFLNSPSTPRSELRYPEQFNHGSPYNVPAGRGNANIDQVIAKYTKEQQESEEAKLKALKDGTLKTIVADPPPSQKA